MIGVRSAFPLLIAVLFQFVETGALAQTPPKFQISSEALVSAIHRDRLRVNEFEKIAEWGHQHQVRVYAAGGTAAGLAHYIRQNRERIFEEENGLPPTYFKSRFGWTYYDIYRSTQDADIVIDGTEAQAVELERYLRNTFPYLQGSKTIWEVRLLRHGRGAFGTPGYKEALLENPHFRNQHSDSHSTGVIELTNPEKANEPVAAVVRDLFDWNNLRDPQFLRDVRDAVVTYYFNPLHVTTRRYTDGNNPPILSVIRFLTKSFQYGGEPAITPDVERIIQEFDPRAKYSNYVLGQLQKNALKLYWHSPDLERARATLERLGLHAKLVALGGDAAVWLNRAPLPTQDVGLGDGATAASLGIDVVAHETGSFLAYENITMSRSGHPNVFISRKGYPQEAAIHGDGFYTRMGRQGARQTKITIRFKVDPNARLGTDFTKHEDFIIFQNRAALKVIDESIELGLLNYLKLLASSGLTEDDRGILFKFQLKLKTYEATAQEEVELVQFVERVLKGPSILRRMFGSDDSGMAIRFAWLKLPLSLKYPEMSLKALTQLKSGFMLSVATATDIYLTKPMIRQVIARLDKMPSASRPRDAILNGLFLSHISKFGDDADFVEEMLGTKFDGQIDNAFFNALGSGGYAPHFERLVSHWFNRGGFHPQMHILLGKIGYPIERKPEWIDQIFSNLDRIYPLPERSGVPTQQRVTLADWIESLLLNERLTPKALWFERLFDWGDQNPKQIARVLAATAKSPRLTAVLHAHPELLEKLVGSKVYESKKLPQPYCELVLKELLLLPGPVNPWKDHEEFLLNEMVRKNVCLSAIAGNYFAKGLYPHRTDWVDAYLADDRMDFLREKTMFVVNTVLTQTAWTGEPVAPHSVAWFKRVLEITAGNYDDKAWNIAKVLAHPRWSGHPELVEQWIETVVHDNGVGRSRPYCQEVLTHILPQSQWQVHEERLIGHMVKNEACLEEIAEKYLAVGKFSDHKDWIAQFLGASDLRPHDKEWKSRRANVIATNVLAKPMWGEDPAWLSGVIENVGKNQNTSDWIIRQILTQPRWAVDPEPVKALIKTRVENLDADQQYPLCKLVLQYLIPMKEWQPHEEALLDTMVKHEACLEEIARDYLGQGKYLHRTDWFTAYFQESVKASSSNWRDTRLIYVMEYLLASPHIPMNYGWMKRINRDFTSVKLYGRLQRAKVKFFMQPKSAEFPEFLRRELVIFEPLNNSDTTTINRDLLPVLLLPHWAPHVDLMLKRIEVRTTLRAALVAEVRTWLSDCNQRLKKND